jgi:hypothetical protein
MLKRCIHDEDQLIYASFEILKWNQDQEDFLENVTLVLKKLQKKEKLVPI